MSSNNSVEETIVNQDNEEFSFLWYKKLGYITIKYVETKANINSNTLSVVSKKKILGFIKKESKTSSIELYNIQEIKSKKLVIYSSMAFAVISIILGLSNPIYFLFAALFIWTGLDACIVIKSKTGEEIKIPNNRKKEAEEFISYIKEKANLD